MSKNTALFKVDAALLVTFAGLAATGIGAHIARHHPEFHTAEHWRVTHTCMAAIFSLLGGIHVWHHARWYASLLRNFSRRRLTTALLSLLFSVEFLTGLLLLAPGHTMAAHRTALLHWACGLILLLLATIHISRRINILIKGLKR